jgi:hypothetical protein
LSASTPVVGAAAFLRQSVEGGQQTVEEEIEADVTILNVTMPQLKRYRSRPSD